MEANQPDINSGGSPSLSTQPSLPPHKRRKLSHPQPPTPTTITDRNSNALDTIVQQPSIARDSFYQESKKKDPQDREREVGILCFVNNSNPGFTATLKQRYTDFIVNEITLDGVILRLTENDFELPKKQKPSTVTKPVTAMAVPIKPSHIVSQADTAVLVDLFGPDVTEQIMKLYHGAGGSSKSDFVLTNRMPDRGSRTEVHKQLRRIFDNILESTYQLEGQCLKICRVSSNAPQRQQTSAGAPPSQDIRKAKVLNDANQQNMYLHCSMSKQNRDTMDVISQLSKKAGIKTGDITYAGTKDRRAVTTQRIAIKGQKAEKIAKINFTLYNARIGNFEYKSLPLELGELEGNKFTITLRDCQLNGIDNTDADAKGAAAFKILNQAILSLQEQGFINYFGLQRFGTHAIGTEVVGMLLLQDNFEGAVEAILHVAERESVLAAQLSTNTDPNIVISDDIKRAQAIENFKKNEVANATEALKLLPSRFAAERAIMLWFSRNRRKPDTNWSTVLQGIPRNLKSLFLHAYQSYVFNHAASERWTLFGSEVMAGDLVLESKKGVTVSVPNEPEYDDMGEVVIRPVGQDAAVTPDGIFDRARALTKEEAESGKFTIFDVVLPTPGFDINYPQNDIGDYYKSFMSSKKGGLLDPADMRRPQRDYSLPGSYRHFMVRPGDITFNEYLYYDENQQLVKTDLEKILDKKAAEKEPSSPVLRWTPDRGFVDVADRNRSISPPTLSRSPTQAQAQNFNAQATAYQPRQRRSVSPPAVVSCPQPAQKVVDPRIAAWKAAPAMLAVEDRALAAAANEAKRHLQVGGSTAVAKFNETWVRTAGHDNGGRRTVARSNGIVGAVVEFQLPSSTYATMVTRELSHGGVQQ